MPSDSPAPELVRGQLDRLLASRALAGSDQLKRLLRLIVERSLEGQPGLLKEYNLGLEVFQRPPDYDPKVDPIVRVQARRLRAKLEEYYAAEGAADGVLIQVPKGAYAPAFALRPAGEAASSTPTRRLAWIGLALAALLAAAGFLLLRRDVLPTDPGRSVAVLPLKLFAPDQSLSHIAGETTEVLTTQLARDPNLRVVSRTTAGRYAESKESLPEIARTLGVRWVVEGGIGFQGTRAYVKLRVVDSQSDRKVWADVYDFEPPGLIQANTRIAAEIARSIAAARSATAR
jgi:TolB-like protein